MEEQRKHYRIGGKLTHCGVEILPDGEDITYIVIERIQFHEEHEISGRKEKNVWVAYFANNKYTTLPMALNSTNRKRIAKLAKTPYLEEVNNFAVRLTKEEARDVQDGGMTWGLRISKIPATAPKKEVLTVEHPKWSVCLDCISKGTHTIDQLKEHYEISPEVEQLLKAK